MGGESSFFNDPTGEQTKARQGAVSAQQNTVRTLEGLRKSITETEDLSDEERRTYLAEINKYQLKPDGYFSQESLNAAQPLGGINKALEDLGARFGAAVEQQKKKRESAQTQRGLQLDAPGTRLTQSVNLGSSTLLTR